MGLVMMDILEEHLDEAAFLWSQWERALVAPDFDLSETAECEERLLAHLDGLVVGGEPAEELLLPALETDEATRISSAAFALLAGPGQRGLQETLSVLHTGDAVQRAGIQRALELSEREGLAQTLLKLLEGTDAALRLLAFQVLSFRGGAPQETRVKWLYHDAAEVVIAALRDPRSLPRDATQSILPQLLVDPRPGVRAAAIETGLISGARAAWKACREVAEKGEAGRRHCLVLLALGGDEQEVEWLLGLLREPALRSDVLWALGFSGRIAAAEACLEWMGEASVAALAGEAFSAITGLRLEGSYRQVSAEGEEVEEPIPLEEEELDAELMLEPESVLPLPEPDAVAAWWKTARKDFDRGARYLRGRAFDADALLQALQCEPMRRRPVHARELAIRSRGEYWLQPRAFTAGQRARVEAALSGRTRLSMKPFVKLVGG
jgi:uncharacterized protein (TIGR02270 family)